MVDCEVINLLGHSQWTRLRIKTSDRTKQKPS